MLRNLKGFNLPEIEERVLRFWKDNRIAEKNLALRKGGKNFVFFEGPPTANARPATHHVLGRTLKDVVLRYKTMRGYFISRKAGWDTQGLPVEIEVEKELGLKSKQEIEIYGIGKFNKKCRESVWKYKDEWEKMSERVGFWLDFKDPYITYENSYLESVWWILKEVEKRGLLKKFYKVVPYCPRCQTTLSSHELGQPGVYRLTKDPSVYVKLKIKKEMDSRESGNDKQSREFLLVWTTTPWTLPANVGVAVNKSLIYKKYKVGDEFIWAARPLPENSEAEMVDEKRGRDLVGWEYEALYKNKGPHKIYAADFVSDEEGTGLVHLAPFGEDDLELMKKEMKQEDLPITVNDLGEVVGDLPGSGKYIKEADKEIEADLEKRGLLYLKGELEHEYPYCWRCSRPLIYFPRRSWFIQMSKLRKDLVEANKKVNWIPNYIKDGRFGNWLAEAKDWAISRARYWGTPLPIWECQNCDKYQVIGGLADLDKLVKPKNSFWVLRHGEADHNVAEVIMCKLGKSDNSALTDQGVKQAKTALKKIAGKKIDLIYCSPFKRTIETCHLVNEQLKVEVIYDDRIKEIDCGELDGDSINSYRHFFNEGEDRFNKKPDKGESLADVRKRTTDFLREINEKHQGKNILIVSHGDPIRMMEVVAGGLSEKEALRFGGPATGEVRELFYGTRPFNKEGNLDLHRPYVDLLEFDCQCGGKMRRVADVADVWLDSGAMPLAQWHYPFENKEIVDCKKNNEIPDRVRDDTSEACQFPADFIAEGIDQTRGWFYTLLVVSVLLGREAPYKNVITYGHLLDKAGQKMSKSKGNVVDSEQMISKYGVDALRWYFYTVSPLGEPTKFDEAYLGKTLRRVIMILYNSYVFWETYSRKESNLQLLENILDRWILARYNEVVDKITKEMDRYQIHEAAREIEVLVDDLSRWYIRRSRKRLAESKEATAVLHGILLGISKLIAPFMPFFAESLYKSLSDNESVHLEDYPIVNKKLVDKDLIKQMTEVRKLASLALAERAKMGIKVRQPLALLKIKDKKEKIKINEELLEILADEVNVKGVFYDSTIEKEVELDVKITAVLRREGLVREVSRLVQGLRQDAGLKPLDEIALSFKAKAEFIKMIQESKTFAKNVGAKRVEFKRTAKFDAELTVAINEGEIWIGLLKL